MSVVFNSATAANVSILQTTNSLFQTTQKRVATGKNVFGAADDATRYKMSETMLGRSRALNAVNNNISLTLKTLEATDKTLKNMISLVEQSQELARKAQAEGGSGTNATVGTTALANGGSTVVTGAVNGSKFSIKGDNGKTFAYTFGANFATVTWGEIVNALNAANIGVTATILSGTNQLQLAATDGRMGFTIEGSTDRNVLDDIGTLSSGTGETFSPTNMFTSGATAATTGQEGFVIANGGTVSTVGTALTSKTATIPAATAAAPQSISFVDGFGQARTWQGQTSTTSYQNFVDQINAMNCGIQAEFINGTGANIQIRFRNTQGGEMKILNGSGVFAPGTTAVLRYSGTVGTYVVSGQPAASSTNNEKLLAYGQQYDAILQNLTLAVANNPVQAGRNLLAGQGTSVIMNEFPGNALSIAGVNVTNSMLSLTQSGSSWTIPSNIQNSATQAATALTTLRDIQTNLSTFNSYMSSRYDLNKEYATDLKTLGDDLVAADVAEESARLTALQTQQQFAVQAFSAGSQNAQSLLRLLG